MRTCVREARGTSSSPTAPERSKDCRVKAIAQQVGVSVSSVSLWVRDVPLTPEQEAALDARNPVAQRSTPRCDATTAAAAGRSREAARRTDGGSRAGTGPAPSRRLHALLGGRGEASQRRAPEQRGSPTLLVVFLAFLRDCYAVVDEQIALSVNCLLGNGLTLDEIQYWWLARLASAGALPADAGRQSRLVGVEATQGPRAAVRHGAARRPLDRSSSRASTARSRSTPGSTARSGWTYERAMPAPARRAGRSPRGRRPAR